MNNSRHFERNLGFLSEAEQLKLEDSVVSIAGAGGDGGLLAVELARMGVGEIRLADPDPFEEENSNRQAVCSAKTVGVNKAEAVGEYIGDINPRLKVKIFNDGITQENTAEFVHGSDLVIDETEFTMHTLGIMLARESRPREIPVLTALNIGFGALVTTFDPNGVPLEKILGFKKDEPLDEIAEKEVALSRWLPYLPKYADLKVFEKVAKGEKSAPTIAPGVAIAAAMGSTQAMLNLVGTANHRPKPVYAPKAYVFDSMTMQAKTLRFGNVSHYRHLAGMLFQNVLKRNPKASY
jgi:tRNA threonylcarbamoyladenosine dehydratase